MAQTLLKMIKQIAVLFLAAVVCLLEDKINEKDTTRFDSLDIFREKPDFGDIKMSLNDIVIDQGENLESFKSDSVDSFVKDQKLKEQRDKLAKYLQTDDVYSLTSLDLWKKIREYIILNWPKLFNDGYLSIPLDIRYNFCVFIVMMIPAEVIFPIPAFYTYLIPKSAHKVPILKDALKELERFFAFVKKRSKKQFLISFYVGRGGSPKEDLDFLLEIPKLITTDPIKILRWLLRYEIKSDGF